MLNQDSYGSMDNIGEPTEGGPVYAECKKCHGKFTLEKRHRELHTCSTYMGRTKEGTLTPATPKDIEYFRICESCYTKLKIWLGE